MHPITSLIGLAIYIAHVSAKSTLVDTSVSRSCDCGFNEDQVYWSHLWHMNFRQGLDTNELYKTEDIFVANYKIQPKYENSLSRVFSRDNVDLKGALQIAVTAAPDAQRVRCGGIGTKRQIDFLYGSFRSYLRTSPVHGTVAAMYMYNPGNEIDIEVLSAVDPPQSYFAIHPGLIENGRASALTHDNHWLGFDPTADFHEYRFDWFPDLVIFYIDGVEARRLTTNIASTAGRFLINHWTDGNANFSQGPPTEDAKLEIMNITILFNSSQSYLPGCQQTKQACSIQNVMAQLAAKDGPMSSASRWTLAIHYQQPWLAFIIFATACLLLVTD
ncbi:hypothetical protein EC973_002029 [Apophysomyces ossiformis]|uniref:GH16 domain-containing protein n=1 Tax=Apophysomyces ossiformis TaxID=679940 RepID=A0A8H7BP90_9FUNG|nr:hypothetical protein EC973_002029 [Apophysomyces ossiformis]